MLSCVLTYAFNKAIPHGRYRSLRGLNIVVTQYLLHNSRSGELRVQTPGRTDLQIPKSFMHRLQEQNVVARVSLQQGAVNVEDGCVHRCSCEA